MTDASQRPDWVMCGIPIDNKFGILASTELTQAQLEGRRDEVDVFGLLSSARYEPMRYELTVHMDGYVLVVADTYEQAFRSLFERWTPRQADRPQLAQGRREIGS